MVFPYVCCMKQYSLFSYLMNIINSKCGTNFSRKQHIGSIAKDTEVQYFRFVPQEDLLRCFPLEMSDRYVIVYMSCSCYCKLLLGI